MIPTYRGLARIGPGRSHRGIGHLWYREGLAAIEYSLAYCRVRTFAISALVISFLITCLVPRVSG